MTSTEGTVTAAEASPGQAARAAKATSDACVAPSSGLNAGVVNNVDASFSFSVCVVDCGGVENAFLAVVVVVAGVPSLCRSGELLLVNGVVHASENRTRSSCSHKKDWSFMFKDAN